MTVETAVTDSGGSGWLRSTIRELRHAPDRLRHRVRRAAAIARVRALVAPDIVLVLCQGNVCRSPYAQLALDRALRLRGVTTLSVSSAGFIGPGRPSPAAALDAAERRGVDLTAHRSMLVTRAAISAAALTVVMSGEQAHLARRLFGAMAARLLVLGDLDPLPVSRRTIHDPWKGDPAMFDASYARIDRCVDVLADVLAEVLVDVPPTSVPS